MKGLHVPPSEFQAFEDFSAYFKSKGQIPFAWFLQILPPSTEVGPFQTETSTESLAPKTVLPVGPSH